MPISVMTKRNRVREYFAGCGMATVYTLDNWNISWRKRSSSWADLPTSPRRLQRRSPETSISLVHWTEHFEVSQEARAIEVYLIRNLRLALTFFSSWKHRLHSSNLARYPLVKQDHCMHEAGRIIHTIFNEMEEENTSALPQGLPQQVV